MYMSEGFVAWFGSDKFFWLLPTKPKLYVNYLERLYTEEFLYKQKDRKNLEFDDYDPSGK